MPIDSGLYGSCQLALILILIFMSFLGPLIAAGSSLIGGVIQSRADAKANENSWNQQKWLLNYNNYSNQRKRMEDAGLNPALMYGGAGGSVSSTTPPPQRPVNAGQGIGPAFDTFMQYLLNEQKIRVMDMQRAKMSQDIVTSSAQAKLLDFKRTDQLPSEILRTKASTKSLTDSNTRAWDLHDSSLTAAKLRNDKLSQEIELGKEQIIREEINNSNLDARQKAELAEITQRTMNYAADLLQKGVNLKQSELDLFINEQFKEMSKRGFTKNDPAYMRFGAKIGDAISKFLNKF